jgi:hypothetical protein
MSTKAANIYNTVSFAQWQNAIKDTLYDGKVGEPDYQDETIVLQACRNLCPSYNQCQSRMDFFLLGFRTMTFMEELENKKGDTVTLLNGHVPLVWAYQSVEAAIRYQLHKTPKSMMEIVVMYHLEVYIKSLSKELAIMISKPSKLDSASYMFLCGYTFIDRLYKFVDV